MKKDRICSNNLDFCWSWWPFVWSLFPGCSDSYFLLTRFVGFKHQQSDQSGIKPSTIGIINIISLMCWLMFFVLHVPVGKSTRNVNLIAENNSFGDGLENRSLELATQESDFENPNSKQFQRANIERRDERWGLSTSMRICISKQPRVWQHSCHLRMFLRAENLDLTTDRYDKPVWQK